VNYFCFTQPLTHAPTHADDFVSATIQAANKQNALVNFNALCVPVTPVTKQVDVLLHRWINANAGKRVVQCLRREPAMLPRPSATDGSSGRTFTDEDELRFFIATHCQLK